MRGGTWHWADGGTGIGNEHTRAATELLESSGGTEAFRMAMLSGSLAAGLGHGISDVDVIVTPRAGVSVNTSQQIVSGLPIQLNVVEEDRLSNLSRIGAKFAVTTKERSDLDISYNDRKDLVRLTIGDPLFADAACGRLIEAIDKRAVRRFMMALNSLEVARHAEDCFGAVESRDALIAIGAARIALLFALEIAVVSTGSLFVGDKVLFLRAAQSGLLTPDVWRLATFAPPLNSQGTEVDDYVRECLDQANHLVALSLTEGWDATVQDFPPLPGRALGPMRNPHFVLQRYADGPALSGPDLGIRISEDTARLWALLDGSPLGEVSRKLTAAKDSAVHARDVEAAVARLRELGAVNV